MNTSNQPFQQQQQQSAQPGYGEVGFSRTITSSSQPPQPSQPEGKKPSKLLIVFVTILVVIFACVLGVVLTQCRDQQQADKYGADEPYVVTGVVEQASEKRHDNSHTYRTIITTDQELPDGSHKFDSTASIDQTYAKKCVGERVEVTIGTDGKIDKITVLSSE